MPLIVAALAGLIATIKGTPGGEVLYLAPEEPAGDLVGALASRGLSARSQAIYRTVPAELATIPTEIHAALIHSAKAARRVAALEGARDTAPALTAVCISAAAAEPLRDLGLKEVLIAAEPNETALLQRLDAWVYARKPVRLFSPPFWIAVSFAAACIVGAILVASLGPRLFPPMVKHPPAATAQPLQFRGKSG